MLHTEKCQINLALLFNNFVEIMDILQMNLELQNVFLYTKKGLQ